MEKTPVTVFWFRRDLRFEDNTGLYHALKDDLPVVPVFIFDQLILDDLEDQDDPRITFIHQEITSLNDKLKAKNSRLETRYGKPLEIWEELLSDFNIKKVYTNHDYEPYGIKRDEAVDQLLKKHQVEFYTFKDQVILEKSEVVKKDGDPYIVYTPFSRAWKNIVSDRDLEFYPSALEMNNFALLDWKTIIPLEAMNFEASSIEFPSRDIDEALILKYDKTRDTPGIPGTSRLGLHLRFGTISIRELARKAQELNSTYYNELIWREFYQMILWHYPAVVSENFNPRYDKVPWRNDEKEFLQWCKGKTGYPIVDAGMRQLNETGFMHNRVRMITASFLTKHLLIDWRWGEAYFARKLLDFELASNNGGWQWAAGTGVDAAPYFRVFNPELQEKKFDPDKRYIHHWVKELGTADYPSPIVEHKMARERAIETYKSALNT